MEYSVWKGEQPAQRSYPKQNKINPADLALEEGSDSNQRVQQSITKTDMALDLAEMIQDSNKRENISSSISHRALVPSQGSQNPFFVDKDYTDVLNIQEQFLRPKSSHFDYQDNKHLNTQLSS